MISVIIPIKNEIKYVAECLKSLKAQTHRDFEVIFVDGGSTDGTRQFLQENIEKTGKFILLDNPAGDAASARNIGIKNAKYEYVTFLDGDSYIDNDWIEKVIERLPQIKDGKVAGIGGPPVLPPQDNSFLALAINKTMSSPIASGGNLNPSVHHKNLTKKTKVKMISFVVMKKDIFLKEGLFDEKFAKGQDLEYATRLFKKGYYYIFDPALKVWHHDKTTISSFIKQLYKWGAAKVLVMRKHGINPAYCIPLAAFGLAVALVFFSIWSAAARTALIVLTCSYLAAALFESLRISKGGIKLFVYSIILFPVIHLSYTAGFIAGLIRKQT